MAKSKAQKKTEGELNLASENDTTSPSTEPAGESFNGVAFTIQANKSGSFSNFRIVTLFIVGGEIVHQEKSQDYSTFEAIARAEIFLHRAIWNLSNRFKHGDYQSLGGEQRDELVARLKKHNPELLEKIAPALYIPKQEESE